MHLLAYGISANIVMRNEKKGKHLHCSVSSRYIMSEDKTAYPEDRDGKKQPHSPWQGLYLSDFSSRVLLFFSPTSGFLVQFLWNYSFPPILPLFLPSCFFIRNMLLLFFSFAGQEEWVLQPPVLLLPPFLYFNAPWPNLSPLVSFCDSKASCTLWRFTFCLQSMKVISFLWENFSCIIFPDSLKFQYQFGWNVFKWFLPKADHQCRKFNPK